MIEKTKRLKRLILNEIMIEIILLKIRCNKNKRGMNQLGRNKELIILDMCFLNAVLRENTNKPTTLNNIVDIDFNEMTHEE